MNRQTGRRIEIALRFLAGAISALVMSIAAGYFAMHAAGTRGGLVFNVDGSAGQVADPTVPFAQFAATAVAGVLFAIPVLIPNTSRSWLVGQLAGGLALVSVAGLFFSPSWEYSTIWLRWVVEGSMNPVFLTLLAVIVFKLAISSKSTYRRDRPTEQQARILSDPAPSV